MFRRWLDNQEWLDGVRLRWRRRTVKEIVFFNYDEACEFTDGVVAELDRRQDAARRADRFIRGGVDLSHAMIIDVTRSDHTTLAARPQIIKVKVMGGEYKYQITEEKSE